MQDNVITVRLYDNLVRFTEYAFGICYSIIKFENHTWCIAVLCCVFYIGVCSFSCIVLVNITAPYLYGIFSRGSKTAKSYFAVNHFTLNTLKIVFTSVIKICKSECCCSCGSVRFFKYYYGCSRTVFRVFMEFAISLLKINFNYTFTGF